MVSDSVANASIPSAAYNSKDLGKKKRVRSAKLKQCKLDVRREQWLSQGAVKNKCCKEETNGVRAGNKENNRSLGNLETRPRGGENDGSIHHQNDSDSESLSNSPTSLNSSVLGGNDSGTNFTGSSSSSSSSSTSSGGCCSGSITEEEEEDDGCLDDWEAVADALAANDKQENQCSESPPEHEQIPQTVSSFQAANGDSGIGVGNSKPELARPVPRSSGNTRAWRPDDAFRPQSLPNLSKQLSLPNSDRQHYGCGGVPWACNNIMAPPSSCPICYEDLDLTDTSFLPCLCGFRLCLFCHKRILDEDGRCPGCRKPYERNAVEAEASVPGGILTFRLARSCSMITRS